MPGVRQVGTMYERPGFLYLYPYHGCQQNSHGTLLHKLSTRILSLNKNDYLRPLYRRAIGVGVKAKKGVGRRRPVLSTSLPCQNYERRIGGKMAPVGPCGIFAGNLAF
jgi:hypothetical protein